MRKQIQADGIYGYIWVLNPMMSNIENGTQFGPFETIEEAREFIENERVEPYQDEGPDMFNGGKMGKKYSKTFRKGGQLEWYNPPHSEEPDHFGHGLHEVLLRVENVMPI